MDFKTLFYAQSYDRESLVNRLDGLLRTESHTVNIIPYASEKSPLECFGDYSPNRTFLRLYSQDGVSLFHLIFKSPRLDNEAPEVEGKFFVYECPDLPNTFVLMTIEESDFIRRALLPFIERSYPRIFLAVIDQQHMNSLLHRFKDSHQFTELKVVRSVLKSRFTRENVRKEIIIPSLNWPYLGLDGAFEYAYEQNGWFQSITFEVLRNYLNLAEITIARNGIMKTSGQLLAVFDSLISPVCNNVHENYQLFRNRSRRDSPTLDVRPLTINFNRDQLADKDERVKLVEVMRLLDRSSVSVIHNNPSLQMSVIDYHDGSTFDLWVLNPRELIIIPQLKGTISAIRRLVSHVFDNYAEGKIEDFQLVSQQ